MSQTSALALCVNPCIPECSNPLQTLCVCLCLFTCVCLCVYMCHVPARLCVHVCVCVCVRSAVPQSPFLLFSNLAISHPGGIKPACNYARIVLPWSQCERAGLARFHGTNLNEGSGSRSRAPDLPRTEAEYN